MGESSIVMPPQMAGFELPLLLQHTQKRRLSDAAMLPENQGLLLMTQNHDVATTTHHVRIRRGLEAYGCSEMLYIKKYEHAPLLPTFFLLVGDYVRIVGLFAFS